MKRKICVVTGSRSEYGLLKPLMVEIQNDPTLTLQLIVSAMHLSPEFGETVQEIIHDGFEIDQKVEMLLSSDTAVGVTKSLGLGVISFAEAYDRLKPDLIVLLGDRFEALAAAQAALIAKIPVAHIHGGELTLGAYDDSIRHSITKMSHIHFTTAPSYRKRVIQLGEDPSRVFMVGPMVKSALEKYEFLSKETLERDLGIQFKKINFLVTYLPETLSTAQESDNLGALFTALDAFPEANVIFTKGNADTEGRKVNALIDEYCEKHSERAKAFMHLGQIRYLSVMKFCNAVIGNSSSGVIEAPLMKIPTVNMGDRQTGREKFASIFDCRGDAQEIESAIKQALTYTFDIQVNQPLDPVKKITEILNQLDFSSLTRKPFYNWEFSCE